LNGAARGALFSFGTEKMVARPVDFISDNDTVEADDQARAEMSFHDYRLRLQHKAAAIREAVRNGETDDGFVLAVAETLERMARTES
jgi:hypothetical protein